MVTLTKEKIEVSTVSAAVGLVISVASLLAVFYNAQASTADAVSKVSERVATQEQKSKDVEASLTRIEAKLDGALTSFRQMKNY